MSIKSQQLLPSNNVCLSLLHLYCGLARFQRGGRKKGSKFDKVTVVMQEPFVKDQEDSSATEDEDECEDWEDLAPESIEVDEEIRLHIMGMSSLFTPIVECNFAHRIKLLPTRYLPTGNVKMLWHQCKLNHKISYLHFWRTFREVWQNTLRFLPPSAHGQCDDCANFKEMFKRCREDQNRYDIAREYKQHIMDVGKDRDLESYLQTQKPLDGEGAISIHWELQLSVKCFISFPVSTPCTNFAGLCSLSPVLSANFRSVQMAQDGMDQSKWRIPRYAGQRPLKSTSMLQRPQLKVQGTWCHNICLDLWVS